MLSVLHTTFPYDYLATYEIRAGAIFDLIGIDVLDVDGFSSIFGFPLTTDGDFD